MYSKEEPVKFLTDADMPPIPEDEFAVYGTVYAHPEHADALADIYTEVTRLAQSEPGTLYYCICRDTDNPRIFHFFERYMGKKAFDAHNEQPIIQKLLADKLMEGVTAVFAKPLGPFAKPPGQ